MKKWAQVRCGDSIAGGGVNTDSGTYGRGLGFACETLEGGEWYLLKMRDHGGNANWRIALIIGWKRLENPVEIKYFWRAGSQVVGSATVCRPDGQPALESWVPNFRGDLNAMREAEKSLSVDQEYLYGEALANECRREENALAGERPDHHFPFNGWGHYALATLDAPTRAAVFLRLFGGTEG